MKQTLAQGAVGITAALSSIGFTLADIDRYVRVCGGVAGLIVAVLTIIQILRRWNK